MKNASIRVRFAPSPTGLLHIGGARTALFNYLFARRVGGAFFLRIEDTDLARSDEALTQQIYSSLRWLGIRWDGDPVIQSERKDGHTDFCRLLLDRGAAYPCFCETDLLKKKRESALKSTGEYRYDGTCRRLSTDEALRRIREGESHTLRFKVPEGETVFEDRVRGRVVVRHKELDDFVIRRSDGTPVYQTAVVVDDHEMGITHVIRGDDHLSNTPKQILLYQAAGWPVPVFAHVPMILGPDKKRLSKRHGATSVEEYKAAGYLPEALLNYLALLGWSPGDDREILSLEEMSSAFSLEGISKNPAVFDETKLAWMNGQYLGRMDGETLRLAVGGFLTAHGVADEVFLAGNSGYVEKALNLIKDRTRTLMDFVRWSGYFFKDPDVYDEAAAKKHWNAGAHGKLTRVLDRLKQAEWNEGSLEQAIRSLAEEEGIGAGQYIHPVRLAITGFGVSPGLFELMALLGSDRVLRRLKRAIDFLESTPEKESA